MHLKDVLTSYERSQPVALHAIVRPLADIYLQPVHPTKAASKECLDQKQLAENTGCCTHSLRQLMQALDIASVLVQQNQPVAP